MERLIFVAALLVVATFLFQSPAQKQSITFSPTIPKTCEWMQGWQNWKSRWPAQARQRRVLPPDSGSVEDKRA